MQYNKLTFVFLISLIVCWGQFCLCSENVSAKDTKPIQTLSDDQINISCETDFSNSVENDLIVQQKSSQKSRGQDESIISLSDEDFLAKLTSLCEQLKIKLTNQQFDQILLQKQLANELKSLKQLLHMAGSPQKANDWEKYLQLNNLQKELSKSQPDIAVLTQLFDCFYLTYHEKTANFIEPVYLAFEQYLAFLKWNNRTPEEEEILKQSCDFLPIYIEKLLQEYDADASEATTIALDFLIQYAYHFNEAQELLELLQNRFSASNFQMVINKSLLNIMPQTQQVISEPLKVTEDIRGTYVQGLGTMDGVTMFRFIPNKQRAEIQLVVDSTIQTQTTGYNRGARINTANESQIRALKSIYWDRFIQTNPAKVESEFQSNITGIDPGRIIGARIVNQKVVAEKPYSEAESKRRTENRFAQRVDHEADTKIIALNESYQKQWRQLLQQIHVLPQNISSRTTQNELFWKANIGKETQLGLNCSQSFIPVPNPNSSVSIQIHESCPNNILFSTFAGKRLNDQEIKEQINNLFSQAKVGKTQFKSDSQANEDSMLWFQFSSELPINLTFSENEIIIVMKFDGFEKDGRSYPKLDVEIIYQIVPGQETLTLQKKNVDAYPGEIERGTTIPARYQAIRTIVMNKLDESLQETIPLNAIDFETSANQQENQESPNSTNALSLFPQQLSTQNGWLNIEFNIQKAIQE